MTKQENQASKVKYMLLLFLALGLFILALYTGQLMLNVVVMGLGIYIYKNGNPILFKEYNEKRKKQLEESKMVQEAVKETIQSKKLFTKNKGDA
ncbi:hypothetical protein [Enterococcus olivae]